MKVYYALWKGSENRFDEPVIYDFSFNIRFPNIVFKAIDLTDAKARIEKINNKIKGIDRFDFKVESIM